MKVIALDNGHLFSDQFEQVFREHDIETLLYTSPDDAIEAFIKHADTELFVFYIRNGSGELIAECVPRLRNVNSQLKFFAVFESEGEMEQVNSELERMGIFAMAYIRGANDIATSLLLQRPESGARRSEHRLDCKLRAYLYEHDPLDQKLPQTKQIVEVVSFSANGAYVASGNFFPESSETYLFEINLPDVIYLVKGRIVWINKNATVLGKPRGFALQFCDMSKAPQDILKHMVEEELVDSILKKHAF